MNINSIFSQRKFPTSRINILKSNEAGAENYLVELISQKGQGIAKMADYLDKTITLRRVKGTFTGRLGVQDVDAVYINSGTKTSRVDLKEITSGDDVINAIETHLRLNA